MRYLPDGRVVVLERDWEASLARVVALEADGAVAPGWPWAPEPTGNPIAIMAIGPESSLYVAVRGESGVPIAWSWELHRLTADGEEVDGFPVALPSVAFCELDVSRGVAYVGCEDEDEAGTLVTTVTAIGSDGAVLPGWPITDRGLVVGLMPTGDVVLGATSDDGLALQVTAEDGQARPGWPRAVVAGEVAIDGRGWIRITDQRYGEDACPEPTRTVYDTLRPDGTRPPGWPVSVRGWASYPSVAADGTMYVATESGRMIAYSRRGRLVDGWPVRNVGVTYSCQGGSQPWTVEGGGIVVVGDREATLISPAGKVASGWPVRLPHALAIVCPSCTPGSGTPLSPVVGRQRLYVAGYRNDRPRIMVIDRDGSMPADAQLRIGRRGDELISLTMAPTGRVWALVAGQSQGEASTLPGSLHLVGEETGG